MKSINDLFSQNQKDVVDDRLNINQSEVVNDLQKKRKRIRRELKLKGFEQTGIIGTFLMNMQDGFTLAQMKNQQKYPNLFILTRQPAALAGDYRVLSI